MTGLTIHAASSAPKRANTPTRQATPSVAHRPKHLRQSTTFRQHLLTRLGVPASAHSAATMRRSLTTGRASNSSTSLKATLRAARLQYRR
eukprot:02182_6